ncbi:hypothetical protein GW17_00058470 [Ensete ventricosum]|nr:hypothetical protein GW17_00058470 [Ensete ventricosum]
MVTAALADGLTLCPYAMPLWALPMPAGVAPTGGNHGHERLRLLAVALATLAKGLAYRGPGYSQSLLQVAWQWVATPVGGLPSNGEDEEIKRPPL